MNTRLLLSGAAAGMAICAAGSVLAQDINVRVNGDLVRFDGMGPRQIEGRVMVPLRGVLEKLGAVVDWVRSTRTVVASRGDLDLELAIGSRTARVNGRTVPLDVPAMTLGGSTMVPLRFVGETLGADVRWEGATQTVLISTPDDSRGDSTRGRGDGGRTGRRDPVLDNAGTAGRNPETPKPAIAYNINSLTHNRSDGWLRAGEVLNVRMRGTPGGNGSFRVPGVADSVAMREVSPGVYEGSWTVPGNKPVNITDAAVIGSLTGPNGTAGSAPLVQSGDLIQLDTVAPKIADFTPGPATEVTKVQPLVSATFTDQGGSGIDTNRTRILVDGRDVTADATITGQFFTYTPRQSMAGAKHTVEVTTADKAGNESREAWSFNVAAPAAPVKGIASIQTNAAGELRPGDVVDLAVQGIPGSNATWSLGPYKNMILREEKPGHYTGQVRLKPGDSMRDAHITTTLVTPDGRKFTDTTERAVSVNAGPPAAPVITFPGPNTEYSGPLVVRGTAQPNSTVRLKVDYQSRALGILGIRGTAAAQEVKVGADGKWASSPINLNSLFGRRDAQYTLSAVTVSPTNETSDATTIRFK